MIAGCNGGLFSEEDRIGAPYHVQLRNEDGEQVALRKRIRRQKRVGIFGRDRTGHPY